jgi:GT2 family glycosyltransferase
MAFVMVADAVEDHYMRKLTLSHLSAAEYFGNPYFEAVAAIENTIGAQMVDFNKMLSRRAVNAPYVERFGATGRRYKASFIVCLYGKLEYMFLQQAMFARQPGTGDYEFIYISNSPHIAEALLKEAKLCAHIYGLDMTLILLNSNAGFGAANNAAAQFASSGRLIIMNPDVFPHDEAWVTKHDSVIAELPAAQTALFGAPLYYDDGSLMHAGMYFCTDMIPNFTKGRKAEVEILRVEHYGKGAPPDTAQFVRRRAVPAVTGAFMSLRRDWFEKLGGFTQDYVFGHYEDADLCLKSIAAGTLPWLHDLRLWHLEGKGSARRPQHEGGSVINRWLFTKTWGQAVHKDLLGPAPAHPGFSPDSLPEQPKSAKRKRA